MGQQALALGHHQLVEQARRRSRHEGKHGNGQAAYGVGRDVEHRGHALWIRLLESPGFLAGKVVIGRAQRRDDGAARLMHQLLVHGLAGLFDGGVDFLDQLKIGRGHVTEAGDLGVAILVDHRQRALRQIAQIVGKVGIDAVHQLVAAIVAILTEGDFAQQEITQRVGPKFLD